MSSKKNRLSPLAEAYKASRMVEEAQEKKRAASDVATVTSASASAANSWRREEEKKGGPMIEKAKRATEERKILAKEARQLLKPLNREVKHKKTWESRVVKGSPKRAKTPAQIQKMVAEKDHTARLAADVAAKTQVEAQKAAQWARNATGLSRAMASRVAAENARIRQEAEFVADLSEAEDEKAKRWWLEEVDNMRSMRISPKKQSRKTKRSSSFSPRKH